jgi:hypothetical protein
MMKEKNGATVARALNALGLRMLRDCTTGLIRVYDMNGGGEFGRYSERELLDFLRLA